MAGVHQKRVRTSDLKSTILHNAQTSIFQVNIIPPPDVTRHLSEYNGISERDRYNIELRCSEASLPATSFMTHEVRSDTTGVTERMAYRRIYDETIDFTFYVDRRYKVIEFFDGWVDYISGVNSVTSQDEYNSASTGHRFKFPDSYRCNSMFITKFEKDYNRAAVSDPYHDEGKTFNSMEYKFIGAYPLTVSSIPVSYGASDTLKCSVRMNYTKYLRRNIKTSLEPGMFEEVNRL